MQRGGCGYGGGADDEGEDSDAAGDEAHAENPYQRHDERGDGQIGEAEHHHSRECEEVRVEATAISGEGSNGKKQKTQHAQHVANYGGDKG